MTEHLVVVGASLAGLRAVESARKSGYAGPITLVGAEEHLPYDRPPLSKAFLGEGTGTQTPFREEHVLRDELGVELMLGEPATGLDVRTKEIRVGSRSLVYSGLIVATGARARAFAGSEGLGGVHTLRTIEDAVAVRDGLDSRARTVVIGAGFIGSEVASAAAKRGVDVTIVEAMPVPLVRAVGEELGAVLGRLHARRGIALRTGTAVAALEGAETVTGVRLATGEILPADMVVVGIGAVPETDWLRDSEVELHERDGGLIADETLRVADGVVAAGDVVHWPNPLFDGMFQRLEHWTSAAEQGALAARNVLAPQTAQAYSTVPYFWSDWYDYRIQFVGSPVADEVRVTRGSTENDSFTALYRRGDRMVGALCVNDPTVVMKYRALIMKRCSWTDGIAYQAKPRARS